MRDLLLKKAWHRSEDRCAYVLLYVRRRGVMCEREGHAIALIDKSCLDHAAFIQSWLWSGNEKTESFA